MPSVAITIPTLRGDETLESCLRALNDQTYTDFQVVVVNNSGRELGVDFYPFAFPIRVISPAANVGFGAAINMAIRATDTRFVATLNDDTEPDAGWLAALVREMESDPEIGMCASHIRLFGDLGNARLDSAGMAICFDGSSRQRGHREPSAGFARSEDVLLPSACAALYRRGMLDEIGLFDEDFFVLRRYRLGAAGVMGRLAVPLCRRRVCQASLLPYRGGFLSLKARFVERNRLWVAIKNFPAAMLIGTPLVALRRYLWQVAAVRTQRGAAAEFISSGQSFASAGAILAGAHWDTLLHLPALLRKRADFAPQTPSAPRRVYSIDAASPDHRKGSGSRVKPAKLAVIIPVLNEEAAVGQVVRSVHEAAPGVPVFVIDDCSSDGTVSEAERAGADVVRLPVHLGLGGCVQTGYKLALDLGFEYVIRVDGDGQHKAIDVPRILEALESTGADVVIGSRFIAGSGLGRGRQTSFSRTIGIALLRHLLAPITGSAIHDPTSGLIGVNRRALEVFAREFPLAWPEIGVLAMLRRHDLRFREISCRMRRRRTGKSSLTAWRSCQYIFHVLLYAFVHVLRVDAERGAKR